MSSCRNPLVYYLRNFGKVKKKSEVFTQYFELTVPKILRSEYKNFQPFFVDIMDFEKYIPSQENESQ